MKKNILYIMEKYLSRCNVGDLRWRICSKFWMWYKTITNKYYNENILRKNYIFKNKHKGERCFILGNGPSLEQLDFSLLKNEYVMTVNRLMKDPRFFDLNSNYHFQIDGAGFGIREDTSIDPEIYLNEMLELKKIKNIVFFVPLVAREVIKKRGIDKEINTKYLETFNKYNKINTIDITKVTAGFSTVVQYAIEVAIYMGFSEIYLLGCDTTILKHVMEVAIGEKMSRIHVYNEGREQEDGFKETLSIHGFRAALIDTLSVFSGYEKLEFFCKKKKIKLMNLSEVTLIDCIERGSLADIL